MAGPSTLWETLQALLPHTKEELKLELGEKVEGSVLMLLQEAAELFLGGQRRECLQTCEVLLDYSWEKLNTGPWQHVDKDWRRVYAFGCLLKAVCLCGHPRRHPPQSRRRPPEVPAVRKEACPRPEPGAARHKESEE